MQYYARSISLGRLLHKLAYLRNLKFLNTDN